MLLELAVTSFLCLGELVDDIDVVGALSFILCLGELVDDIDVVGAVSFLVPVFRGTGGRY
jgi:hypothetical protein